MSDDAASPGKTAYLINKHKHVLNGNIPWGNELGFELTRAERGHVWGRQPWKETLVGDPETGVIHGSVITAFLDNLGGAASAAAMDVPHYVATLDLRIDYMRPAEPRREILGEAECYRLTRTVAFIHAWAYHESREKVIATAAAAFAITKPRNKA